VPSYSQLSWLAKQAASNAGFDLAGIAPVSPSAYPELDYFARWIEAGRAGEMEYLKARDAAGRLRRAALDSVAPWARSAVVCAINYNSDAPYSTTPAPQGRGWISRYAWGPADYHASLLDRLRRLEAALRQAAVAEGLEFQSRCYVDTGPVIERVLARYAGVGWIGKNTCIIDQRLGSWLFLGVVLTSLELSPDLPAPDRCGSCTRCIDACPTAAIPAPYELDATRCIAYLTIEKRGAIPEDLRAAVGRHVFGCDICQDVCPWNRRAPATSLPEFQPRPELVHPALDWLASLDADRFRQMFRGTAVRRTKFSGWRRNLAVAMGNSGDPRLRPHLEALAADADPQVAEHARWALHRLDDLVEAGTIQKAAVSGD
jgi:epoxyqueuosine reductase